MKAVGKHFAKIAEIAYARHGAAWAGLLSNWPEIVGSPLSDICVLEKVKWPGGQKGKNAAATSKHQKIGGVLVLKVAWGRALEVQHSTPQIIDRINAYYGYQAISQIKIIQGNVQKPRQTKKKTLAPLNREQHQRLDDQMRTIEDETLKQALLRLARGVLAEKSSA